MSQELTPEQAARLAELAALSGEKAKLEEELSDSRRRQLENIQKYKWKKGQSGNPGGVRKDGGKRRMSIRRMLIDLLSEEDPDAPGCSRMEVILRSAIERAGRGNFSFAKDIIDRVDEDGAVDSERVVKYMPFRGKTDESPADAPDVPGLRPGPVHDLPGEGTDPADDSPGGDPV